MTLPNPLSLSSSTCSSSPVQPVLRNPHSTDSNHSTCYPFFLTDLIATVKPRYRSQIQRYADLTILLRTLISPFSYHHTYVNYPRVQCPTFSNSITVTHFLCVSLSDIKRVKKHMFSFPRVRKLKK